MLYFTFVHPQLLYGVEVYANTCKSHLEKLLFLITNCCALLKTVQYEHVLWTCTNVILHYHYHYFTSIMCFVSCMNVTTVVLLYQMSSKTIFVPITSFIFMVLGLMTGYICTLLTVSYTHLTLPTILRV